MGHAGGLKRVREAAPVASRVRDPAMKQEFAGEPERYDEVFTTMRAFQESSVDAGESVDRVKVLLGGYPEHLSAFNQFVPWNYIRAHAVADGSSH